MMMQALDLMGGGVLPAQTLWLGQRAHGLQPGLSGRRKENPHYWVEIVPPGHPTSIYQLPPLLVS